VRILLVHGGAVWATHDVYTGLLAGLQAHGHLVREYALGARLGASHEWLQLLWRKHQEAGGPLQEVEPSAWDEQHHASEGVLSQALRFEPDWVVVVCGAYFHPDIAICAARAGLRLAVVFTESPYDDTEQAKAAPLYRVCFTNERTSVPRLREANPQTHYLPMGYDPAAHGPGMNGEAPSHDVVFVGTGFESRVALLSGVDWSGIGLGLYGVWPDLPPASPLKPFVKEGLVDNAHAGELYRKARIGLNLYRSTGGAPAESLNPRAYELAADGVFTVAQPRAEQTERLGGSVATFTTAPQLEEAIRTHLADAWRRRRTAEGLPALVSEDTYHHRAARLVAHLPQ
jgi:spore maturation protein CgeB